MGEEERRELRDAAELIERLAATSTRGRWQLRGLLATRPEVVAEREDGSTEHVAEARAASGHWITAMSPAVGPPLAGWLRSAARTESTVDPDALSVARALLDR
ncbi:hypothetical protein DFQ14_104223 [Halopolyspora algeriensis]|uniref:Uncharacterized protein n=1 Tax=Halopolyspora algeriensis TaxID=1500506 RepID=A0A368VYH9_9ACTN|nr:hypothetical protein [Halopolyspora algeriensis]RCW44634.1 hypothetical protein DFQ14_104223 [Halopolyspora algeriensis]TQM55995.1 hypothetical protein FHU43_0773 [Halopolyspora algeriensis]